MNSAFRAVALLALLLCHHQTSKAQPAAAFITRITGVQAARLTASEAAAASELAAALNSRRSAATAAALLGLKASEPVTFDHAAALNLELQRREIGGLATYDPHWSKIGEIQKKSRSRMNEAVFRLIFLRCFGQALEKAGASPALQAEAMRALGARSNAAWGLIGEGSIQYLTRWNEKPRHPIGILIMAELLSEAGNHEDTPSGREAALDAGLTRLQHEFYRDETAHEARGRLFAAFRPVFTNSILKVRYEQWTQPASEAVLVLPLSPNNIFLGGPRFLSSRPQSATFVAQVSLLPDLTKRGWIRPVEDVELQLLRKTPAQFPKAVPARLQKVQLQTAASNRAWIWFDNSKEFGRALAAASSPPGTPPPPPPRRNPAHSPVNFDEGECDLQLCVNKEGASATFSCGDYGVTLSTSGEVSIGMETSLKE